MLTLFLSSRYTEDSILLWRSAIAAGWDVIRVSRWEIDRLPESCQPVLYGEVLFVSAMAEALKIPLVVPPADWLTTLPNKYLQRQVRALPLEVARHLTGPLFFKPAELKTFPAGVYENGTSLPCEQTMVADEPVLVADPVIWETEFRCFVIERNVVACSPYLRRGVLAQAADGAWPFMAGEQEAVLSFTREFLADEAVAVPPAFVLDVGWIAEQGWAVVEANSACSSGLCGCDPAIVLSVLAHACNEEFSVLS